MDNYFSEKDSIYEKHLNDTSSIIKTIAYRYMGENPPHPVTFRAYNISGIKRIGDYRYCFDLDNIFPATACEMIVYAWSKLWSEKDRDINLTVSGYGPVTVFFNGQMIFKTNILNERSCQLKSYIKVALNKGWNYFILKFIKTNGGFGGLVGTASPKSLPLHFIIPSADRDGQEGWLYTSPLKNELKDFPTPGMMEEETGVDLYPVRDWPYNLSRMRQLKRIYGIRKNYHAFAWTSADFGDNGLSKYELKGSNQGPITIYLDERIIYNSDISGEFSEKITISCGKSDILVKCRCTEDDWGFDIRFIGFEKLVEFESPSTVKGSKDPWFYLGVFDNSCGPDIGSVRNMHYPFKGVEGLVYWRLDMPDTWIRPYMENTNFGQWNYPLGVALYGLLGTGKVLGLTGISSYVTQHVNECTHLFRYALWDKEQYGASGVHHLLTNISCLDDCGSFGSLMLEIAKTVEIKDYLDIAHYIAEFIENRQSRLDNGTFFRNDGSNALMGETLWADDLYMSVPFLCRYYKLTEKESFINDAAKQLLHYYRYLFIPEKKVMSHVYDFRKNTATSVPWGRGNGWVAFAFSELLAVLPEDHSDRRELIRIFNELCEGYLALQDEEGMWHQVLTDHESYCETSCTSMFIYAFARGVRYGWLENKSEYTKAVFKAWQGLCRISIDKNGNIYGVCRGSGFSFTSDYYKNDLSWNLNDTHGIGIVLLAGLEVLNLSKRSL